MMASVGSSRHPRRPRRPVFISYARASSLPVAEALHRALGGATGGAFLDSSQIAPGGHIPSSVFRALLDARVVVMFVDGVYFTRRYCVQELMAALRSFRVLSSRGAAEDEREEALWPFVLALPAEGAPPNEMVRLPAFIQESSWPSATETARLAELVVSRLERVTTSIGERLDRLGELDDLRDRLTRAKEIPVPQLLRGVSLYPQTGLLESIGDAFIGRADELWDVHTALATEQVGPTSASLTAALEGGGGFGKTRLALEYLRRYGPQSYRGGLFWINADVPEDRLQAQLHGILRILRQETPDLVAFRQSRRDAGAELSRALREMPPEHRVLYIVDNVPEPEGSEAPRPLSTWCPAIGEVALLVTSRFRRSLVGDIRGLSVGELSPDDAVSLLTYGHGRRALPDGSWRRIARWVGEFPLALELLNASLRAGALSAAELLRRAEAVTPASELDRQVEALRGKVPDRVLGGIAQAFDTSYRRLPPGAQRAARLVAWLSPEAVPFALVEGLGEDLMGSGTRADLVVRSFVMPVAGDSVEMFGRMHPVLADFLRSSSDDAEAEQRLVRDALLAAMPAEGCLDPGAWPLMEACRPHAEALFARAASQAGPTDAMDSAVTLGIRIGLLLLAQGRTELAVRANRDAVALASRVAGETAPATLIAMNNLAVTLQRAGDMAGARRLQERVLDARRATLGEAHRDTLKAMGNLASTLRPLGDLAGAREMEETVLERRIELLGEDDPDTLNAKGNLAATLRALGDLQAARRLEEQVLEARLRLLGEGHVDSLAAKMNLAVTLGRQGDRTAARKLEEDVLETRRRLLGARHPDTVAVKGNLATSLSDLGDLKGARALEEEVLRDRRSLLGDAHPDTLTAKANLAVTLGALGDVREARALEEEVLRVAEGLFGEEHQTTLDARANLAVTLRNLGDLEGAVRLERRVLEARERLRGERHPDTLTAKANLAIALSGLGELATARRLEEEVLAARRALLGEDHPLTLQTEANLAVTLFDLGEQAQARALQERVLEARRRLLGDDHPDTLTAKANLALTWRRCGELTEARGLEQEVMEGRERTLGEDHPDTLTARLNFAATLFELGDVAEAGGLEQDVLERQARLLGLDHPDTLTTMVNLSVSLAAAGDLPRALALGRDAVEGRRRLLGDRHPATLTAMFNLALAHRRDGDLVAAARLLVQLLEGRRSALGEQHPDTAAAAQALATVLREHPSGIEALDRVVRRAPGSASPPGPPETG